MPDIPGEDRMEVDVPHKFPQGAVDAIDSNNYIQSGAEIRLGDAFGPNVTNRFPDLRVLVLEGRDSGLTALRNEVLIPGAKSIAERGRRVVPVGRKGEDDGEILPECLCVDLPAFDIDPDPFQREFLVGGHLGGCDMR